MNAGGGPDSAGVSRLVGIARTRVQTEHNDGPSAQELTEDLAEMLRVGSGQTALIERTERWLRRQEGVSTAWFEQADRPGGLHAWSAPGAPWNVDADGGTLRGTTVWSGDDLLGSLITWSDPALPQQDEARSDLVRAAVWLGSSLSLLDASSPKGRDTSAEDLRRQLVTTVSHEVRTPLSAIRGGLELMLEGDLGDLSRTQHRMLERLHENALRLQKLADSIVHLGDGIENKVAGSWACDPREVAADCAERLHAADRVSIHSDGVEVGVSEVALTRILHRIIENALVAGGTAGHVSVRAERVDDHAEIVVEDHGVGIPDDEITQVTEAFFRTRRSRREQTPGAGLGLTIAENMVRRGGGWLEVTSREGEGTQVRFGLPVSHQPRD